MLDIIEIRDHARKAAVDGRPYTECPYSVTSLHGQLWLDFYTAECHWIEHCNRKGHGIPEHVAQPETL